MYCVMLMTFQIFIALFVKLKRWTELSLSSVKHNMSQKSKQRADSKLPDKHFGAPSDHISIYINLCIVHSIDCGAAT